MTDYWREYEITMTVLAPALTHVGSKILDNASTLVEDSGGKLIEANVKARDVEEPGDEELKRLFRRSGL